MEQRSTVEYTGNIEFASTAPPPVGDVLALEQELMLDITAADSIATIGQNVHVVEVVFDGSVGLNDDVNTALIVGGVAGRGC
jgi:hypothetical protein